MRQWCLQVSIWSVSFFGLTPTTPLYLSHKTGWFLFVFSTLSFSLPLTISFYTDTRVLILLILYCFQKKKKNFYVPEIYLNTQTVVESPEVSNPF